MARKYARDNRGRFASKGGGGATARGGRLKTASGNKRATQTMQVKGSGGKLRNRNNTQLQNAASKGDKSAIASLNGQRKGPLKPARTDTKGQGWGTGLNQGGAPKRAFAKAPSGTIGKPKGLKPGAISGKLKPAAAANRAAQLRQRAAGLEQRGNALMGGGRQDRAATNVSLNSRARRNETNAGLKGLEMTRAAANLRGKADRVEQRAQQSAAKALRTAANPKRTRSNESMRLSRAKQVEKRRGMNINNPAAWRQESAGRMAANAKRTQERALAFYKGAGKAKPAAIAAVSKIQKTRLRFGDDDYQSDRKWVRNETAKLDRQQKRLEKELAGLKRAQAAAAKPAAKRKAVGSISDAKAGRIIARIDANRPGQRRVTGSLRKSQNASRTHQRATEFVLGASKRARSRGNSISVNESVRRAVSNAAKKRRR